MLIRLIRHLTRRHPWALSLWENKYSWNSVLISGFLIAAILVTLFLNSEEQAVSTREVLRLTSSPHIVNLSKPSLNRGKPLSGLEVINDAELLAKTKYQINAGVYVVNNYDIDLTTPGFSSKGYIFMNWNKELQQYLESEDMSILNIIKFKNDINPEITEIAPKGDAAPTRLEDGNYGQTFAYTGEFYIDNFNISRYPFDALSLPIVLETDDPDGRLTYDSLRLIPDIRDSGIGGYSNVIGWHLDGWSIGEYRHHLATSFGSNNKSSAEYSQLIFDVTYGKSPWSSFWKLIQPLLVVMASIILITRVKSEYNLEIPLAVLLTLVFMQEGYRSGLPELPYLTYLDQIFVLCYIASLLSFALVLYTQDCRVRMKESNQETSLRIAKRLTLLEKSWPPVSLLVLLISMAICWIAINN